MFTTTSPKKWSTCRQSDLPSSHRGEPGGLHGRWVLPCHGDHCPVSPFTALMLNAAANDLCVAVIRGSLGQTTRR